jgi:hypothetical protein
MSFLKSTDSELVNIILQIELVSIFFYLWFLIDHLCREEKVRDLKLQEGALFDFNIHLPCYGFFQ